MTDRERLDLIESIVRKGLSTYTIGETVAYLIAIEALLKAPHDEQKAPIRHEDSVPEPVKNGSRDPYCEICKCPTCARQAICDSSCMNCSDDGFILRQPHTECERYVQS